MDQVKAILAELSGRCRELKFLNTICKPTSDHQQEIRRMPQCNDVMIIVGSFTSANTTRLTQIAAALNPKTYQVQSVEELQTEWFAGARRVGISAGASTPDWILEPVVRRIGEITGGEQVTEEFPLPKTDFQSR
jgi:4-hydroxy-3-methylbut-2-enyl diphosphate reductase